MNQNKPLLLALIVCAIAFVGTLPSQAQTSDRLLNALIKKGVLTEDEAKAIAADVNAPTNDTGIAKFVTPRGNPFKLKLEGFIQANAEFGDAASFEGSFRDGPNQVNPRFRLRRARIGVIGEFLQDFDFKLEGDFQQGDGLATGRSAFSGTDLYINWHRYPEANFRVGQFMTPFGYEMMLPDMGSGPILLTAERSLANTAIVPERQVGMMLTGKPLTHVAPEQPDLLTYWGAIVNGDNRNTVVNDNSQFMYVGRLESVPFAGDLFNLPAKWRIGGGVLNSRDAAGTRLSQVGNLLLNSTDGSLTPFTSTAPTERVAWSIDQTFTAGPFDFTAEYFSEKIRSTTSAALTPLVANHFTANGYYLQPSVYVYQKKLQLVGKWERFNPGQAPNDGIQTATAGVNWYIYGQNVMAMVDFMHTWSDYRRNVPGNGKSEFNELLVRLQLYF